MAAAGRGGADGGATVVGGAERGASAHAPLWLKLVLPDGFGKSELDPGGRAVPDLGLGLLLQGLAFAQGLNCSQTQFLSNGRCCNRCPPGQKVEAACSGQSNTTCSPCEEHHFQDRWTGLPHCTQHRPCSPQAGLVVYRNGSKERDVVCRCQEGKHCSSHECETCRPHSLCGPGEGVQREGNHLTDTLCAPCSLGYFSNVSSSTARCQPWSRPACGVGTKGWRSHQRVAVLFAICHLVSACGSCRLGCRVGQPWGRLHESPPTPPTDLGKPLQEPPEPTENEEDCPAFPTQETLLGEQTGTQEKECHLAQQEQV
ncbi:tumor necrosis factor receptor superfamily member 5-like [Protobothrops mucrosquamatus]|uniref:tumor necrosis factor receptor superfamily member 5-like n=1 Tax=Protobothrops mucrosquamatus TaxID=103944 RepID=UPI0010FB72EC|nr:tumor necrosis factor receptor superfamily member 5-like [Protobothrops mucrosquamatus]